MTEKSKARLDGIESLRAFAAIGIILFHLVGVGQVVLPPSLPFIGSHFGLGVPLFFVVSAFSLSYGYCGRLGTENALKSYFVRRFTRIAPLFYFIMAAQLIHLYVLGTPVWGPWDVFINAIFAFNFIPHLTDGIVPASWSIGVEMLFYVIFPVSLIFVKTLSRSVWLLVASIIVATQFSIDMVPAVMALPSFISHNFILNFPYFCWGLVAFHAYSAIDTAQYAKHRKPLAWAAFCAGAALVLVMYKHQELSQYLSSLGMRTVWESLWGFPFAVMTICLALHPIKLLSNTATQYLGKISFSLYLVHPTIIYYLWKTGSYKNIVGIFPGRNLIGYGLCAMITVAIITAIASITYRFIETPGMALGKRLTRRPTVNLGAVIMA